MCGGYNHCRGTFNATLQYLQNLGVGNGQEFAGFLRISVITEGNKTDAENNRA